MEAEASAAAATDGFLHDLVAGLRWKIVPPWPELAGDEPSLSTLSDFLCRCGRCGMCGMCMCGMCTCGMCTWGMCTCGRCTCDAMSCAMCEMPAAARTTGKVRFFGPPWAEAAAVPSAFSFFLLPMLDRRRDSRLGMPSSDSEVSPPLPPGAGVPALPTERR